MNILRRWNGFAYSAQGYRDAVPMPTVDTTLTILDDSWDSPIEDFSALEESTAANAPRLEADSGQEQASNLTLDEQWMAVHGIPAIAWAEVGFVGIKADMAHRAAATPGTKEEIRSWDPEHRNGTRVQIV